VLLACIWFAVDVVVVVVVLVAGVCCVVSALRVVGVVVVPL